MVADAQRSIAISIPAGSLRQTLDELARQTGISIGMAGALPSVRTRSVAHARDVGTALRKLLAGTPLQAIRVGAMAWRIEPRPLHTPSGRHAPPPPPDTAPDDIIITAGKREERLVDLPTSISIVGGDELGRLAGRRGLVDLITTTDSAFSTNLGPGRDRIFLRGIADSAFGGASQSVVSVYLDDARIGYASPDPDLRMVDIDRVEILRGPQGTLYGTGALGGVVRIVTVQPDLDHFAGSAAVEATGVEHGAVGGEMEGTINLPIVTGRLALRASGWGETMPGWIDDTSRRLRDINRSDRRGGRAALAWAIGDNWKATLDGTGQWINTRDSQYATAGLTRSTLVAEPQDNDFFKAAMTIKGQLGQLDVQSTTSIVNHEFGSTYDASTVATAMNLAAPLAYHDDRTVNLRTQEVRVSDPAARHPWIIGASILDATSHLSSSFKPVSAAPILVRDQTDSVFDAAVFAEGTQRLTSSIDAKVGLRGFITTSHIENEAGTEQASRRVGITPSATLNWHNADVGMVWLRYASAVRPIAVTQGTSATDRRVPGDELDSIELGWRLHVLADRLTLNGAVFGSHWEHVQSDVIGSDGLLGTVDAGTAMNYGVEAAARLAFARLAVDVGTTIQRARLTVPAPGLRDLDDRRLPVVPDFVVRAGLTRSVYVFGIPAATYASVRYIGQTHLSFDPKLDQLAGNYAMIDGGVRLDDGARHWSIDLTNLLDTRSSSFGFGNPFTLRTADQTVPVRPRTVTLRFATAF